MKSAARRNGKAMFFCAYWAANGSTTMPPSIALVSSAGAHVRPGHVDGLHVGDAEAVGLHEPAQHEMQHRGRRVDGDHLALQVLGRGDGGLEIVAQDQRVAGIAGPVARARHDDAHRPVAREGVVERGADAAADHLDLVGRERRRRLGGRGEALERDVELLGGEVALFDGDIEGRIGDDAELADLDRLGGCSGGPQAEHAGQQQSMHGTPLIVAPRYQTALQFVQQKRRQARRGW